MLNEELSTTSSTRYRTTNAVVKAEEEEGDDVNMSDVDVTDEILQEEQEEENEMESKPALHSLSSSFLRVDTLLTRRL